MNEILKRLMQQLGGNQFLAMTGAKITFDNKWNRLYIKLPGLSKVPNVSIKYDENFDSYLMAFFDKNGWPIQTFELVFADQLQKTFTSMTGLDTHL
jgi:hypothetical protein